MSADTRVGAAMAAARLRLRTDYGSPVTYKTVSFPARRKPVPVSDVADIATGIGLGNQQNPDWWLVTLSPSDFTGATPPVPFPQEGDALVWNDGFALNTYRIAKADAPSIAGAVPSVMLVCYRESAETGSTVAPTGETGAGSRKVYKPTPSPIQS